MDSVEINEPTIDQIDSDLQESLFDAFDAINRCNNLLLAFEFGLVK